MPDTIPTASGLDLAFRAENTPPNSDPAKITKMRRIPEIPSSSIPARISADIGSRSTRHNAKPARLPIRTDIT
jgi:hypothetical protein